MRLRRRPPHPSLTGLPHGSAGHTRVIRFYQTLAQTGVKPAKRGQIVWKEPLPANHSESQTPGPTVLFDDSANAP